MSCGHGFHRGHDITSMSLFKQTVTKVWLVMTGSGSVTFMSGTVCDLLMQYHPVLVSMRYMGTTWISMLGPRYTVGCTLLYHYMRM